jgi:hypothetical protein
MVGQEKGGRRIHVRILWVSKRLSIFLEVKERGQETGLFLWPPPGAGPGLSFHFGSLRLERVLFTE